MHSILHWVLVGMGVFLALGTLASLTHSPHWAVRNWDFPRVQIAVASGLCCALYAALYSRGRALDWAFLATTAATLAWQCYKIRPYTPLASIRVKHATPETRERRADATFKLLISNVLMENREHDRFLGVVRDNDPDVVLALETDAAWARALEPLTRSHPHTVAHPQENYYGMMLFSRLPLVDPQVSHLVQDDIPSIHTGIRLKSGDVVALHGLHPRPPEPIRDQHSTPRDAELVLMGRAIGEGDRSIPTVVAGDLNDVAWSPTSELFLRLSGLLDPRMGRGFFNSFNAKNPVFRFPLDHVFHSNEFELVELRRLDKVGSDHFPIQIELVLCPEERAKQPETKKEPGDDEEADERIEEQIEAAATGDDRPSRE